MRVSRLCWTTSATGSTVFPGCAHRGVPGYRERCPTDQQPLAAGSRLDQSCAAALRTPHARMTRTKTTATTMVVVVVVAMVVLMKRNGAEQGGLTVHHE